MKCVIFGGGGFIGSAIADRMLLDGHTVRIFARPRVEPFRKFKASEQVEWITGDFLSTHDVGGAIDGADVVLAGLQHWSFHSCRSMRGSICGEK